MNEVIIMIGVSMAGKSKYVSEIKSKGDYCILNCDNIRMMLTGEKDKFKAFKTENEFIVWDIFYNSLDLLLKEEKDIIIDNTNCNLEKLKPLISVLREYDVNLKFISIDTDIEICKSRLKANEIHMKRIMDNMQEGKNEVIQYLISKGYCLKIIS